MFVPRNLDEAKKRISQIRYFLSSEGYTLQSAQQTLETLQGHCLEGAFAGALLAERLSFEPRILYMVVTEQKTGIEIGHGVAALDHGINWSSIGHSRFAELTHRDADFSNPRDLASSYSSGFRANGYEPLAWGLLNPDKFFSFSWRNSKRDLAQDARRDLRRGIFDMVGLLK